MSLDTYRRFWNDPTITAIALNLEPGVDTDTAIKALQVRLAPLQKLLIRPNLVLQTRSPGWSSTAPLPSLARCNSWPRWWRSSAS